jgi:hypothetical protein
MITWRLQKMVIRAGDEADERARIMAALEEGLRAPSKQRDCAAVEGDGSVWDGTE